MSLKTYSIFASIADEIRREALEREDWQTYMQADQLAKEQINKSII